jgi:hypothetical protein
MRVPTEREGPSPQPSPRERERKGPAKREGEGLWALKFAGFLGENAVNKHRPGRPPSPLWYLLLLAPFFAMFWVPSYNRIEPTWGEVPFFYWYQLLWIPIGAG